MNRFLGDRSDTNIICVGCEPHKNRRIQKIWDRRRCLKILFNLLHHNFLRLHLPLETQPANLRVHRPVLHHCPEVLLTGDGQSRACCTQNNVVCWYCRALQQLQAEPYNCNDIGATSTLSCCGSLNLISSILQRHRKQDSVSRRSFLLLRLPSATPRPTPP